MCRLFASTDTNIPGPMRKLFFNQLAIYAQADGNHGDGAGVTDGTTVRKSAYPYTALGLQFLSDMREDTVWLGHVRKKSPGTELTPFAAHPFKFTRPNGSAIYAAHNGTLYGYDGVESKINSDSYKAFQQLVTELGDAPITAKIIDTWTSTFDPGSEWTFMFTEDGADLTIAVGHRDMCSLAFGNGQLFCTSGLALENLSEWAGTFWPKSYKFGKKIVRAPKFTLIRAKVGEAGWSSEPLDSNPATPPTFINHQIVIDTNGETLLKI